VSGLVETASRVEGASVPGDHATILANLGEVRRRMAAACNRAERLQDAVRLLPVTKMLSLERMRAAFAAGLDQFSENKVQEAKAKAEALADLPVRWSVIGHLRTNNAKHVVRLAHDFQALDNLKLAEALDRRLQIEGRGLGVLVQVNTSAEPSKYGLDPDAVLPFVRQLPAFASLRVLGLMTLAIFSSDEVRVRACFQRLREVQTRLRQEGPAGLAWDELSMGMSGDFETAIEEGATVVRVGQAIFGPRPLPDSHYWPDAAGTRKA
jgi:pyridoxal phosphate enzyme (YggS family)